jgi:hypothetical protein
MAREAIMLMFIIQAKVERAKNTNISREGKSD